MKKSEQALDYNTRVKKQEVDDALLRRQIKQLGNTAPANIDEGLVPESLKDPPIENTGDMVARSYDQQDDRYRRTAQIACDVRQEHGVHEQLKGCTTAYEGLSGNQRLTAGRTSPRPAKEHDGHPDQANPSGVPPARRSIRVHILLVEDNIINQKIVFRKLEREGYKVTVANNGREAVELMKCAPKPSAGDERAFDICLMDMEMPIMNGNAATRTIRELERQGKIEHVPILGVTANVRSEQQAEM